ncbi:MAG: response regulator [Acidobacteria bacterium]|nr:response regulator [Acidobacteriota bacterium]
MSWLSKLANPTPKPEPQLASVGPIPEGVPIVLLVEDEPAVRGLFAMCLRKDGYFVLEASNGSEALNVVEQVGRVDLVVTDVVMPIMKGTELAQRLREKFPTLRFIFVSGYVVHDELGPNAELLQKPFLKGDLLKRVVAILGPAATGTANGSEI